MPLREKHAVLLRLKLSDDELGSALDDKHVDMVEDVVRRAIRRSPAVGEWDGHEFGEGWAVVFLYGRHSDLLRERVLEALLPLEVRVSSGDWFTKRTCQTVSIAL